MVVATAPYFYYWAKTNRGDVAGDSCHLLPYHLLDVAAVAQAFLACMPRQNRRLAVRLGLDEETFRRFFVYAMALHDIGKFARSFQGLATPSGVELVAPDSRYFYDRKHDALGLIYWRHIWPHLVKVGGLGLSQDAQLGNAQRHALELWFGAVFGHHGRPVDGESNCSLEGAFKREDDLAAWSFMEDAAHLLVPVWPLDRLGDKQWRQKMLAPASWELAGLAVLVDWLGSDQEIFGYRAERVPLPEYWDRYALPGAAAVLAKSGVASPAAIRPFPGFQASHGFAPTPLQAWAESAPVTGEPQLYLLEDQTGTGKTEAALTLVHRLLAQGAGEGLYFALPTMATSSAMYERVASWLTGVFRPEQAPSLVLAHGARQLHEAFNRSVLQQPSPDQPYDESDPGGVWQCSAWLADSRKKALLAEVGVGTIDQALLGLLPRKHQSLRLFGLQGKVLVLDEVHAYDAYTSDLLQRLLTAHARHGGSAVLLSATIPLALRRSLVDAWHTGAQGAEPTVVEGTAFPLATRIAPDGVSETPVAARDATRRDLRVAFLHEAREAVDAVVGVVRSGRCVCWVRNTVDDAIDAYRLLLDELGPQAELQLFHARFVMGDRQRIERQALETFGKSSDAGQRHGAVLVATQVVEQSLDLDFDVLVSDLAPIDLLIQRAGRLRRHARDSAGNRLPDGAVDERPGEPLYVLAPPWSDSPGAGWLGAELRRTSYVYKDVSRLWLTCRVLRRSGGIRIPEEAREVLEAVYAPDIEVPDGLQPASDEASGERTAHHAIASFNALALDHGYCESSANGQWDADEEVGTRLADEPTVPVVVLTETEQGVLQPLHARSPHPWAMSTVQLRVSWAKHLPAIPETHQVHVEALREANPWLSLAYVWIIEGRDAASLSYDSVFGVCRNGTQ